MESLQSQVGDSIALCTEFWDIIPLIKAEELIQDENGMPTHDMFCVSWIFCDHFKGMLHSQLVVLVVFGKHVRFRVRVCVCVCVS